MMVVLGVLLGGAHAYGTSWKDYPYGTPSIADTFLFGDYSNKTNKQITAPDLAKYVVSLKLPDITESNGLVTLTAPILGTSAGFSSLYDGSGQLPASTSIALNTDPKIVLAKTNITVTTSGPITAGVVQTANGATINLTNTFVQKVFTNGTVSYVDPNGNDSIARRGVRDYPYLTLTNAVAGASNNDTIVLMPGSYVSSSAKISKPLTITGSGVLNTVVTFSTNNSVGSIAGFIINSANISLKNMTIKMQPQASGYVDAAIYLGTDSSGVPAFGFNSVVATNLWLENLDLNGYSDVVYFFSSGSVNGNAKNVRFSSSFDTFNIYSQSATYFNFQNCEFNAIAGTPITNNMCRALVANGAVTYTATHSKFNIQNGTTKNTVFCVNSQFSGTPPTFYSFDNAFSLSSAFTTPFINDSSSSAVTPSLITDLSVSPSLVKASGYNVTYTSDGRYQLLSSVITNYVSVLNSTNGYFTYVTNANGSIAATFIFTNTFASTNGTYPQMTVGTATVANSVNGSQAVIIASAKTNITVITSGPIAAGVVQTANGATINLTNTYVPPIILTNLVQSLSSTNGYFTYSTNANGSIVATYVATNIPTSIIEGIFTNVVIFSPPPTSSISTGIMGSLIYSTNYLYLCVSNNSWLRCPMYSF